ncbi:MULTISPECIES: DUF2288 domain-containing protein [Methylococcus]|jgi:hypothetical protein|uniref:DUF2288 domain-containing protein n=1 Tax=Methylococcus capsulatus (strain ATCC 33009 / NCIMB 11132 / Bath) TaxID=243233 RepID=Q602K7_METCA|nr:DUF2288 domain-containing protein [Methylococcus capsulatus]AAU90868.1 conserved hypothetical protein [Methylococcus capsulatus str. Bath]QXP86541.1 DUF2288 domain-containing protein [Methylococcus capsulatus]QXP89240.1 DUF2288 domain-containing protein [Methylococcus capsulatus]QXP93789.1 DUF2288 domain-containing protein [Methylococcus capsulatus]UQN11490.1 DUF2288 domain-containing protein [Methylococcus capsulatus]
MAEHPSSIYAKLNLDSGKLTWQEMQPHFARGAIVRVAPGLDLIEVATVMAADETRTLSRWLRDGQVGRATATEARDWHERDPLFWAVVVAPWVLVQEIPSSTEMNDPSRSSPPR